jgi:hypothetical protein
MLDRILLFFIEKLSRNDTIELYETTIKDSMYLKSILGSRESNSNISKNARHNIIHTSVLILAESWGLESWCAHNQCLLSNFFDMRVKIWQYLLYKNI